jgi:alkylresorcinol/alkylpyrone synthase
MSRILSVATAVPEHRVAQSQLKALVRDAFGEAKELLEVFDHAGVETRYLAFPPDYYTPDRSFEQRNDDYGEQALKLLETAAGEALRRAALDAEKIDHVILASSTGLASPTLDALLAGRLRMREDIRRTPMFGLGCAGGVAAVARAMEYLKAFPKHRALVLSVELCGQVFYLRDPDPANAVVMALFGDGAAAAVVGGEETGKTGPRLLFSRSALLPGTAGVMGMRFDESGLHPRITQYLPQVVEGRVAGEVERLLMHYAMSLSRVRHWMLYPGGPRLIEAYEKGFGFSPGTLESLRAQLREYGNLGSVSPFFLLEDVNERAMGGEMGVMLSIGPGVAVETVILRW